MSGIYQSSTSDSEQIELLITECSKRSSFPFSFQSFTRLAAVFAEEVGGFVVNGIIYAVSLHFQSSHSRLHL